jgi:hypothetical protein
LWLLPDLIAHAVGKPIAIDHHSLRLDAHLDDDDLVAVECDALVPDRHGRAKPALRHGQKLGDGFLGVAMARQRAVVIRAQQQRAAIGVCESL